ncbi:MULTISPECIES: hypothetical protein [Erysipelotrichaceae]|uniref:hypothetical protein n=1 Tax=Erysipelotrichaceae TaxID=128827 RepID=UPI000E48C8C4|nr:hypothetical protein [Absiella sp. AM27-20]RHU03299.1 hypothetical protein DW716_15875 [Absiella sp. AM27-20]
MKLKEAMDKYGDYEVKEKELEKILIKPKPKTVWDLENEDVYYIIEDCGDISKYSWDGDKIDKKAREMGNVFLTEQEAKFEYERRKVEAIMLKYGRRTFKFDYNNFCILMYNNKIVPDFWNSRNYGGIFFDTEELAKKAIDEIGEERLIKYYLRTEMK